MTKANTKSYSTEICKKKSMMVNPDIQRRRREREKKKEELSLSMKEPAEQQTTDVCCRIQTFIDELSSVNRYGVRAIFNKTKEYSLLSLHHCTKKYLLFILHLYLRSLLYLKLLLSSPLDILSQN